MAHASLGVTRHLIAVRFGGIVARRPGKLMVGVHLALVWTARIREVAWSSLTLAARHEVELVSAPFAVPPLG